MKIEIDDSIREAGLEPAVTALDGVYNSFIPPDARHLTRVAWSVARGALGQTWAVAELDYDGAVERDLFDPTMLTDEWDMRTRLSDLLWRARRTRSDRRLKQLAIDVTDTLARERSAALAGQN